MTTKKTAAKKPAAKKSAQKKSGNKKKKASTAKNNIDALMSGGQPNLSHDDE